MGADPVYGKLEKKHLNFLRAHSTMWRDRPQISILIPAYRPSRDFLAEALESVERQSYENWEICLVDDASGDGVAEALAEQFANRNPGRIRFLARSVNGHISAASNDCLALAAGEYVALLDHDDRLMPHALSEMVRSMNQRRDASGLMPDILYSDETTIHADGTRNHGAAFHKPAWAPEFHLRVNYTTHLSVYRTRLLRSIGGFREGLEGAQDHDLMLRAVEASTRDVVHVPEVLYEWRMHPESTASGLAAKDYATDAGIRAVSDALERRGTPGQVLFNARTLHYEIVYALPDPPPRVSIVVPTRDRPELVKQTLENVLRRTDYPDLELILVDNGTVDRDALDVLDAASAVTECQVIRDSGYFNFARLCNVGVAHSTGDVLVLLNNDVRVVTPLWLRELAALACLPGVGAVGPKLQTSSGRIQSAGLALLGDAIAGSFGAGEPTGSRMYVDWLNTVHEVSAVTGACLVVRRSSFDRCGGLDEVYVPNAFGDVDFCLKLRSAGLRNIFTPHSSLIHEESSSRGLNHEAFERQYMRQTWGLDLLNDPYVNPHFVRGTHFTPDARYPDTLGSSPVDLQPPTVSNASLTGLRRSIRHEGWRATSRKMGNTLRRK